MTTGHKIAALTRQYLKDNNAKIIAYKDVKAINEQELEKLNNDYKHGDISRTDYEAKVAKIKANNQSLIERVNMWANTRFEEYSNERDALVALKPSEAAEMAALVSVGLTTQEIKKMLRDDATTYTQARMLLDKLDKVDHTAAQAIRATHDNLVAKCEVGNAQQLAYTQKHMPSATPMNSKLNRMNYTEPLVAGFNREIDEAEAAFDAALAD
jgi:hypothetical protein